jgi:hypothetical protein
MVCEYSEAGSDDASGSRHSDELRSNNVFAVCDLREWHGYAPIVSSTGWCYDGQSSILEGNHARRGVQHKSRRWQYKSLLEDGSDHPGLPVSDYDMFTGLTSTHFAGAIILKNTAVF